MTEPTASPVVQLAGVVPTEGTFIATPSPTPGWKTSEFWITLLVILIGALPSSGLIADGSQLAKIVGLAISVLSGLGYMAGRTGLKRAHVIGNALGASSFALAEPANENACPTCGETKAA